MDKTSPVIESKLEDASLYNYKIKFTLKNIDISLGNAFRRIMISELPNIGFHENDIEIHNNTSVLHNQFLEHRISLIPIRIYNASNLKIYSKWYPDTGKRVNQFSVDSAIPRFSIDINNDKDTRELFLKTRPKDIDSETIIDVTSQDIMLYNNDSDDIEKYIKPDLIIENLKNKDNFDIETSGYILVNKLKVNSEGVGDVMNITFKPSVGNGKLKTIYSPVGTVAFSNVQDVSRLDEVFRLKLISLNQERTGKSLPTYSQDEVIELRKEFDTLDAKRVYLTDELGEANAFNYSIESIGSLTASQIFKNSVLYLYHKLLDLSNSISFTEEGLVLNKKKIDILENQVMMDSIDIKLNFEEHTIGNLLSKYMQKYFTTHNALSNSIFNFVSYIQKHPLDDYIILRLNYDPNISLQKIINYLKQNDSQENLLYDILNNDNNFDQNSKKLGEIISIFLLQQTIYSILRILRKIIDEFDGKIGSKTLETLDNQDYIHFAENSLDSEIENIVNLPDKFLVDFKNINVVDN